MRVDRGGSAGLRSVPRAGTGAAAITLAGSALLADWFALAVVRRVTQHPRLCLRVRVRRPPNPRPTTFAQRFVPIDPSECLQLVVQLLVFALGCL